MQVLITGNPWMDAVFTSEVLMGVAAVILAWLLLRKSTNIPGPFEWPLVGAAWVMKQQRPRFLDWLVELQQKVSAGVCGGRVT